MGTSSNPFGTINLPDEVSVKFGTEGGPAIGNLIQTAIWILIIAAGIYTVFNIITAGYAFMSAGDDVKKVAGAWAKIWQSLLGLAVAAGAFVLAAIFGQLLFGSPDFLLRPQLPEL